MSKKNMRYEQVAVELPGFKSIYINKIFPIFVSKLESKNPHENMASTRGILRNVSFIRGTFDIEKILAEAALLRTERQNIVGQTRFKVHKNNGSSKSDSPSAVSDDDSEDLDTVNVIGYQKNDLGMLVSKKPFESLFYTDDIVESIKDIRRWNNSKDWYEKHCLNWRYGICLYGRPGTGKTSFVRSLAQDLDMPIDIYDLSTMDNNDFNLAWSKSLQNTPRIVLLEDFDRQVKTEVFDMEELNNKGFTVGKKPVTLDCLLNCIAGIEPADGILLAITCNDISKLDDALGIPKDGQSTRPGRIDKILHFDILTKEARQQIASKILSDCPQYIDSMVEEGDGDTGAQFQFRCSTLALKCYWNQDEYIDVAAE